MVEKKCPWCDSPAREVPNIAVRLFRCSDKSCRGRKAYLTEEEWDAPRPGEAKKYETIIYDEASEIPRGLFEDDEQ